MEDNKEYEWIEWRGCNNCDGCNDDCGDSDECETRKKVVRVAECEANKTKSVKLEYKHFQYASDLVKWVNENKIKVVSISDAGAFSEGQILYYLSCQD